MCILCDHGTLELLTTPLESLSHGRIAEAVRAAREAAGPGVLDHAEAVLRGDAESSVDANLYDEVVGRALESGVLSSLDATAWAARLEAGEGLRDPRVQAFLSSSAEILDEYSVLLVERQQVVERFVEAPSVPSEVSRGLDEQDAPVGRQLGEWAIGSLTCACMLTSWIAVRV